MKRTTIKPLDAPRDFRHHEMFFSRTNKKGIIQAGNDVFVRISGYRLHELQGQPHNIIRHPDMPRAVFRLIWDYLEHDKAVAGYVKNLAADGHYYWVVALIAPLADGHLSVRFKPTSALYPVVEQLYGEMRAIEIDAQERGLDGEACMNLSTEKLEAALSSLGFPTYDAFMDELLQQELSARDAVIASGTVPLLPDWSGSVDERGFKAIHDNCRKAYELIGQLHQEITEYTHLNDGLRSQFQQIAGLTQESRLVSLNIMIKAAQLNEEGRCIDVVAAFLGAVSSQLSTACDGLTTQMFHVSAGLREIGFALASARLQMEMVMLFCHELGEGSQLDHSAEEVDAFMVAFDGTIAALAREMNTVKSALAGMSGNSNDVQKLTMAMQVAQVSGAVEASWMKTDDSLSQTFRDVRRQTDDNKEVLTQLQETIARFDFLSVDAPAIVVRIIDAIKFIKAQRSRLRDDELALVAEFIP